MSESTTDIAQASRKPMHIGSYRVIGKIGQGGMGTVYKAIQTSIDRIVALKVLAPHLARDAQFVDRFLREARSAARLSHRNLVCVYDCGEQVLPARRADGTDGERTVYYFSMEYVEGCTLGEWVQRHGLPDEHDGLGLMRKLAVVLGYAHERNLVHRDVKPDNILIDAEGEPRLCDLGLAKPIDALVAADDDAATNRHDPARIDAGLTQVGTTLGTPRYMAPEQVTRAQIDGRTDLYALAATFFHVFTGRPLFVGDDGQSVGRMHLDRPPTPIRQLRKEFSRETEALLLEMLAKRPDRRPADAATVAARIDRIRAGAARAPGRGQPRPG
ncbi:MAG: serine/threonine-protein kinase, partial [Planctomycetota bacterium]